MRKYFSLPTAAVTAARPVITIGVFDGVHLGHQAVLARTVADAKANNSESVVVTFDTHPRALLSPADAPKSITSLEHRLGLFKRCGVDVCLAIPFSPALASLPAEQFVRDFLCGVLGMRVAVMGHDTHFGRGREGNAAMMEKLSDKLNFSVIELPQLFVAGMPVSSTAIRKAVAAGELDKAAAMLGRPVSVLGSVVSGKGLARKLGFPTMNLDRHHELSPPRGVYFTRSKIGEESWPSITNIGHRPTVDAIAPEDVIVETHILGEVGNLYGQVVEVIFLTKLRDEVKFPDHESLARQIAEDTAAAKKFFQQQR